VRRTACAALACALTGLACAQTGCTDPREAELAQELVSLQESRTAKTSFEAMRREADASGEEVAGLEREIEALRPQLDLAQAAVASAEDAYRAELDRNAALNAAIAEGQGRIRAAAERQGALEQELTIARGRAQTFKDQAAVLVKQLRPDDPEWALRLHMQTLREFLGLVGQTWPRDPVLSQVARDALPGDDIAATVRGAELAGRVRDRVTEIYGLEDKVQAGETPAVAAEPGRS
jgi:hypothetical protein